MSTYVFDNSWEQEHARLAGIESVYDPGTIRHLEAVGVGQGWHCLEVAGGGGSITRWLCERVGRTGKVVATDIDTRFLEILEESNLDVRRHNVVTDELPEDEFDLIHGRLIVEQLPDRDQVLKRLVSALKPGGWIVIEDLDWSGFKLGPDALMMFPEEGRETAARVWAAALEVTRQAGSDEQYGRKLPGDLIAQGLVDVGAEIRAQLQWGGSPGTAAPIGTLERLREPIVAQGVTNEDIDRLIALLSDVGRAQIGPPMTAAWGRRAPSGGAKGGGKGMPPRTETVRSWLRSSPLFAKASEVEMSRIASLADELHVEPGEELTVEGQPGKTFFVIAKGTATVSRGGRRLVGLGPGSYFGEIALLESGPRTATVTADSRMWLFVFDASGFASLMNGIPAVSDEIFRALAERKRNVER